MTNKPTWEEELSDNFDYYKKHFNQKSIDLNQISIRQKQFISTKLVEQKEHLIEEILNHQFKNTFEARKALMVGKEVISKSTPEIVLDYKELGEYLISLKQI